MKQLLNQHSYVLVGLVALGIAWVVVRLLGRRLRRIALAAAVILLAGVAMWLRTGAGDIRTGTELDRVLAKGKPVALEFYSNY
jgi:hypothetical protein